MRALCIVCNKKANKNYFFHRHSPCLDWSKWSCPWELPSFYFCSQEHRDEFKNKTINLDKKSLPYLAYLDESMNYCEYFNRTNWNEWIYKKELFEFEVNWLWDYKNNSEKFNNFKKAYIEHFWDFNRFNIHNRYDI